MARLLITGGFGFIGSHVARWLADNGHDVCVFDAHYVYGASHNRASFADNMTYRQSILLRGIPSIQGSTCSPDQIGRALTDANPECVVHLGQWPVIRPLELKAATRQTIEGTLNLLSAIAGTGIRIVSVSSSMVYGEHHGEAPLKEDHPRRPVSVYGGLKLAAENLIEACAKSYKFSYAIVRPTAVYGEGDVNGRVLQNFVEAAIQGQPLLARNPDNTFLDFSYVADVADGICKVALTPAAANEVFNISRGESHSLTHAISILRETIPDLNVRGDEGHRPASRRALDISKARQVLGFAPRIGLREGLTRYAQFVRDHNPGLHSGSPDASTLEARAS